MDIWWYENQKQIDALHEAGERYLDIVEVWSKLPGFEEQFTLRGSPRHMARCRFHTEKTPSLRIWSASQCFLCHGCGKGGDVFTLFEEFHSCMTSWDAIRIYPAHRQQEEIKFFKEVLEKYLGFKVQTS